ncbi:unnamed protein product, partial [Mesorhabditis spiculigera]
MALTCLACGQRNARKCYGSIACNACKIFFLRTTAKNATFTCFSGGKCVFPRDDCRACRYQQCLNAGLIPNIVARREGCTLRTRSPRSPQSVASTSAASSSPEPKEEVDSVLCTAFLDMGSVRFDCTPQAFVDSNVEPVKALLQLEAFCNGDDADCPMGNFTYNLDLCFEDVLRCPTSLCLRIPAGLSSVTSQSRPPPPNLARQFSRLLLHVVDYVRGLAEVSQLPPKDQVAFCKRQHLFVAPFIMYAYTYRVGHPGLVAGLGEAFQNDQELKIHEIGDFLHRMIQLGQSEIIPAFRETQMDDGEYVLLKNILIFHSAHGLSETSAAIIREARKRYEWMLTQRIRYKSQNDVDAIYKVAKLMGALKSLVELGFKRAPFFSRCVALDICGLRGRLPADVYIL